jgi:NAD-dependent deacetylase
MVRTLYLPMMLTFAPTDRIFILAGAGVSAESGIPTFRGAGGLWRNHRIEEVASLYAWHGPNE